MWEGVRGTLGLGQELSEGVAGRRRVGRRIGQG